MVRSKSPKVCDKSAGPSKRITEWTEYLFLAAARVIALFLIVAGNFIHTAAASVLFWRVLVWLRSLRK
jgi:hypothetical protein